MRRPPRANSYRDTWCADLSAADAGRPVRLAGWVHRRRDHGGVVFIDLRDRSGLMQLVFHPERGAAYERAHALRPEQVLSVSGTVVRRGPENVNPAIPTGEVEVAADSVDVLAEAHTPPFPIDEDTPVDELIRLRHRPLDLRRASMQAALRLRHELVALTRRLLDERDFMEIETPILTRSTPEGARDFLVPSRLSQGAWYALPQSPQLFKQLLMVAGYERYFQIARCFRDEDLRADRQPEFTQLDLEMSFVVEDDVIAVTEEVLAALLEHAGVPSAKPPWPRLSHAEAMLRFGSDRPDVRFGMELTDVSELVRGCEFRVFQSVLEAGGVVRALDAGPRELSRAELEGLNDVVRRHGAAAVAPIYVAADGAGWEGNLPRFFSGEQIAAVNRALAAQPGDLLLFVADREAIAATALGALRLELASRFGLLPCDRHELLWVVDFPMFEWNEDEARWEALHHPFTAPVLDDRPAAPAGEDIGAAGRDPGAAGVDGAVAPPRAAPLLRDPASVRSRGYDLVMDGVEIGGGSIRIHREDLQREVFGVLGMERDEAQARFGFLLEALGYGAPPHGGIALGIDRIVALCAGRHSIRDVIAFPKTASGLDPLTGAPAPVDPAQLRELGVRQAPRAPAAP